MPKRHVVCSLLASLLLFILIVPFSYSQSGRKRKSQARLICRGFSYPVTGSASELVQADDATFNAFAAKVRTDLDTIFRDYEIDDKSTMRTLLSARLDLEELAGEYQDALKTVDALRALEEKPAAKLTTGLFARALAASCDRNQSTSGPGFDEAFTKHYREAVDSLPWDVVQDSIKRSYRSSRIYTNSSALGGVKTDLDPAVQKSGALDNLEAWDLISTRNDLQFAIPLGPARAEVLKQYIAAHNVVKPDIWAAREVTLTKDQKLSPVLVAIWDSGIDVSLFPDQLFTDPKPTASGTHGLAFDDQAESHLSHGFIRSRLNSRRPIRHSAIRSKDFRTLRMALIRPKPTRLQKKFSTLSPDQMHQLFELNKVFRILCSRHSLRGYRRPRESRGAACGCPVQRSIAGPPLCSNRRIGPVISALPSNRCPTISGRATFESSI